MVENTAAPARADSVTESAPAPERVSLKRFCIDLSVSDRRVELIGGFEHTERVAGRLLDTKEAYAQRYADFANAPAK